MGMRADQPSVRAEWVLAHGGVVECNTFTKMYLCALGQYDYDAVPAIPPEIVLSPNWFYFNIYEISSWSRSILVPLAIIYAKKPYKKIPAEQGIDELFVGGREVDDFASNGSQKSRSWRNFFLLADHAFMGGSSVYPAVAKAGLKEGREVDAGALGDVRWPGRDLSRHAERDRGAALPRLFG